jgi:D-alanine-D-alanine ligase
MLDASRTWRPTAIPAAARDRLNILFIAKHALWQGSNHPDDGNHAIYHREMRETLERIGVRLTLADSYNVLFDKPDADFVFPLLNRGGFLNSEMLLPLLCVRHGLPFLGASPILRGLSDDKHLSKLEAAARDVPTAPWSVFRRGARVDAGECPDAGRWVIKPNASSASWGVRDAVDRIGIVEAVLALHAEGHDVIVEPFLNGSDVEVPVIISEGRPRIMPMMLFEQADPAHLRTYAEKRDLVDRGDKYRLVPLEDEELVEAISAYTERLIGIFAPFDYGRFEFRVDPATRTIHFLEVNLNCNLWSQKVFGRSAERIGFSQTNLIETILAESLMRQGLC